MPKVLIVEDDELIAKAMATHLAEAGFDPLCVATGEAGISSRSPALLHSWGKLREPFVTPAAPDPHHLDIFRLHPTS